MPGRTNIWEKFQNDPDNPMAGMMPQAVGPSGGIGTPDDLREAVRISYRRARSL